MASGDTLFQWRAPGPASYPASNFATPDVRNNTPVFDFDAATEEMLYILGLLPRIYGGGGLTIKLHWAASSATSGNVVWGVSMERQNTDLDSDSFASEQTATSAANGTSGIESVATITMTSGAQMDSLATGDPFRMAIARKAASGSDTMAGDAELIALEIYET